MMEFAVKGARERANERREREDERQELRLLTGGYFYDPGNSQETHHRRDTETLLLGALIQYLINSILPQSRDLAYSRGRAASILRAVAKGGGGGGDTWRLS